MSSSSSCRRSRRTNTSPPRSVASVGSDASSSSSSAASFLASLPSSSSTTTPPSCVSPSLSSGSLLLSSLALSPDRRAMPQHQFLTCFKDIFKCTICIDELTDPHLCPRCSKMYCYDCIDEWLDSGASQSCPNCKLELRLDQLVKVRWFDDIEKLQRNLRMFGGAKESPSMAGDAHADSDSDEPSRAERAELCVRHGKPLNFYCSSCKQCICEGCATDTSEGRHRDHTFKALHVTYEQHLGVLGAELDKVEHYRDKLAALVDKIDRNVELIGRVKRVKRKELEALVQAAQRSLDRQAEEKVGKLHAHRHTLAGEMGDIERKLKVMRCDMANSTRSQLIQLKPQIIDACNAIRMHPIRDFKQIRVPASLKIEIPVIFETGIFVVQNFSTFDDNKVVYSSEFSDCLGRTWRIMAWCVISEDHFGIYLELVNGPPCGMECTFQLIHDDPTKTISKTIRQYFDRTPQKGWGLRDFVTLNTIVDEGYLRDNDSLELLYHIRPCSAGETQHSMDADESLESEH